MNKTPSTADVIAAVDNVMQAHQYIEEYWPHPDDGYATYSNEPFGALITEVQNWEVDSLRAITDFAKHHTSEGEVYTALRDLLDSWIPEDANL